MGLSRFLLRRLSLSNGSSFSSSSPSPRINIAWEPTGQYQKTVASCVDVSGTALHSGARTTARLAPAMAGEGRYFVVSPGVEVPASIEYAVDSRLCTTLGKDGAAVRTVEHLLSALEASSVDNCRIEVEGGDELPILDGSSKVWLDLIHCAGLVPAEDRHGNNVDRVAPFLLKPVYLQRNDSFAAAFPSSKVQITYGIDFPRVPAIDCQWFSCFPMDIAIYAKEIARSRTFCIHDEVEKLHASGLIQGGSLENAIVCSPEVGWLNPSLHFHNEPCRHKVLDLVGDLSLLAQNGSQGLPVAHVISYKVEHRGQKNTTGAHSDMVELNIESIRNGDYFEFEAYFPKCWNKPPKLYVGLWMVSNFPDVSDGSLTTVQPLGLQKVVSLTASLGLFL